MKLNKRIKRNWIFAILLIPYLANSQVELVSDPNPSDHTLSSRPSGLVQLDEGVCFAATDYYGNGFWKSDGTPSGTKLITRKVDPNQTYSFNNTILIFGSEQFGSPTYGLWVSDGTEIGTVLIKECSYLGDPQFTTVGNKTYFRLMSDEVELWVSEGTPETTYSLSEESESISRPDNLTSAGDLLFFSAGSADFDIQAWRSDGTSEGTFPIMDFNSETYYPYGYCQMNDTVYFIAGNESWASLYLTDGNRQNTMKKANVPVNKVSLNHNDAGLKKILELDGTLYFALKDRTSARNDIYSYKEGEEISLCYAFPSDSYSYPITFYKLYNALIVPAGFYSAISPASLSLLRIDDSGPEIFDTIMMNSSSWDYERNHECDTVVYFEYGRRLIRTDGTSDGTYQVNDGFFPNSIRDNLFFPLSNKQIIFSSTNDSIGEELWIHDLDNDTVTLLMDINHARIPSGINVKYLEGDKIYFTASDPERGNELWITSAHEASAHQIKDIFPGTESSSPDNFIKYGNELYFTAFDGPVGEIFHLHMSSHVWKTDGTESGTKQAMDLVTRFVPGDYGYYKSSGMVELGGKMILAGSIPSIFPDSAEVELFESSGTSESTKMLKDINTIYTGKKVSSKPFGLTKVGDQVYFIATTHEEASELWTTDGTEGGTRLVKELNENGPSFNLNGSSTKHNLTAYGDRLLFTPYHPNQWRELWVSDGSEDGTYPLTDVSKEHSMDFYNITSIGANMIFWVDSWSINRSMWVTDGSLEGTKILREAGSPEMGTHGTEQVLGELNGQLYFMGTDGVHGFELWKTDGTVEGTAMVKDLNPGIAPSNPTGFIAFNGGFHFFAESTFGNTLLWRSDGTSEGTLPVPAWDGEHMTWFGNTVHCGEYLYFSASDIDHGQALYRIFVGASGIPEKKVHTLSISPNPAASIIRIDLSGTKEKISHIEIFDLSGKKVLRQKYGGSSMNEVLDISSLGTGMYFVQVAAHNKFFSGKIIKK